jgi:hypothetical protein
VCRPQPAAFSMPSTRPARTTVPTPRARGARHRRSGSARRRRSRRARRRRSPSTCACAGRSRPRCPRDPRRSASRIDPAPPAGFHRSLPAYCCGGSADNIPVGHPIGVATPRSGQTEPFEGTNFSAKTPGNRSQIWSGSGLGSASDPNASRHPRGHRHFNTGIWRAHIGLDLPNDLAREAWSFLTPYLGEADGTCSRARRSPGRASTTHG